MKHVKGGNSPYWGYTCQAPNPIFSGCYVIPPDFTCIDCVINEQPCMGPFLLTSADANPC